MNKIPSAFVLLMALWLSSCSKEEPVILDIHLVPGKPELLVILESTYTITSEAVTGGRSVRSGYATMNLKTIGAAEGKKIAVKEAGRHQIKYIGFIGGKVWFYSDNKEQGLHTRRPEDLEVEQTFGEMLVKADSAAVLLSSDPGSISSDTSGKHIFLTTTNGYHYLFDPTAHSLEKTTKETMATTGSTAGIGEVVLGNRLYVNFKGDTRMHFIVARKVHGQRAYDFYAQGGKPVSEMMYTRRENEKAYEAISFIKPVFVGNPVIYDNHQQVYILSRTSIDNDYGWVLTAAQVTEKTARVSWQYEIAKNSNDKAARFVKGLLTTSGLVLAFENKLMLINTKTGRPVWMQGEP